MGHGRGAHTGFVGKHTPGNPSAQRKKSRTHHAAGDRLGLKSTLKNGQQRSGNRIQSQHQHQRPQQQIQPCRKRHQQFCRLTDPFGPAQQQKSNQHSQ